MECLEKNPERNIRSDDPAARTASLGNKAVAHSSPTPELA
jgi:hypothetical protein